MSVSPLNGGRAALPGKTPGGRKVPISHRVGRSIVENCRAGQWHSATVMAEKAGVTEDDVHRVMNMMCKYTTHGARAEKKKLGAEYHYRIFKQDKTVSVEELTTKLRPIV